jgi:SAM-dependent methyltransferase|tara:strand:- start:3335 stop:3931 length:597 start_codon:yes stop_codon:yes gene_type:complete
MAEREFDTITYLLRVFFSFELKKGCSILDLGSGDQFLKDEFEKRKISYSSLDIKDLDFEKDKFIFDDNKFDLVISLAVLEHLKDPNIFLNESRRVLKNESYLFLSTPNWKYSKNIFYDDVTHVKPYSPESLNEILSIKNFKNIKIMPNLRCKSRWWYEGSFKFFKACYLLPFTNNVKFIPKFLKGKSRGMFVIAKKDK